MSESTCTWFLTWRGPCGKPATSGHLCAEHSGRVCVSCGAPADQECGASVLGLGCGAPLCGECRHEGWGHIRRPEPELALIRAEGAWRRAKVEAEAMGTDEARATLVDLFEGVSRAEQDYREHLRRKHLGET